MRLVRTAQRDLPPGESWLAPAERAVLEGFRFAHRRADWRLGRLAAKRAVSEWLAGSGAAPPAPERIAILAAVDGAPEVLVDGAPAPLVLSLSHREGHALAAVAAGGVLLGCDLEHAEPRSPEFVADYLTAGERAWLALTDLPHAVAANLLWSAKESALKALRQGLRRDPRSFEAIPGPGVVGGGWEALVVRPAGGGEGFAGWWRCDGDRITTVVARPAPFLVGG